MSTVVCALTLALPSVVLAQDEAEETPSPFCAVLTAEEASVALGVPLIVGSSSATDCSYEADIDVSDVSLIAQRDYGPLTDVALYYPDAVDLAVSGHPAFYSAEATGLFVDEGANDQLLILQVFGATPDQIDVQAALEGLAEAGLPRLASIPLPVEPTEEPEPSYFGDQDLATLIPTEVEGEPVGIETYSGADLLADIDTTDPETQELLTLLQDELATQGRTTDDLSVAYASYATEEASGSIQAVRVKGADIGPMAEDLVSLLLIDLTDAVRTPGTVGTKDVTIISDEPLADASATASDDPFAPLVERAYLYASGEVVWLVIADEPGLTEVLQKLP